jgi:hypothetical protein
MVGTQDAKIGSRDLSDGESFSVAMVPRGNEPRGVGNAQSIETWRREGGKMNHDHGRR